MRVVWHSSLMLMYLFYCFENVWSICNLHVIVCYACVIHVLWCVMLSLCSVNVSHIVLHSFDILMHSNEATHQGHGPRKKIKQINKTVGSQRIPFPAPLPPKKQWYSNLREFKTWVCAVIHFDSFCCCHLLPACVNMCYLCVIICCQIGVIMYHSCVLMCYLCVIAAVLYQERPKRFGIFWPRVWYQKQFVILWYFVASICHNMSLCMYEEDYAGFCDFFLT